MERNPEIRQMLNNPEVLRQMMEIARNPSRLQEMTRTMDRQMQNLESMPGGQAILQRMYRDVQEPVLNAMGGPPFPGPKRPGCTSCPNPINRDNSTGSQPLGPSGFSGCTCNFRHVSNPPSTWSWSCFGSRRGNVHQPWHAKSHGSDEGQPNTYVPDDVCSIYAGHLPRPAR